MPKLRETSKSIWGSNFALEAMCVCPPLFLRENKNSRGVRHDCGTALNEATTIMGYRVWSTRRTCSFLKNSPVSNQKIRLFRCAGISWVFQNILVTDPALFRCFAWLIHPHRCLHLSNKCVSHSVPKSKTTLPQNDTPHTSRQAGGQPREHSRLPNEEGYATTDMEADHLHVPA